MNRRLHVLCSHLKLSFTRGEQCTQGNISIDNAMLPSWEKVHVISFLQNGAIVGGDIKATMLFDVLFKRTSKLTHNNAAPYFLALDAPTRELIRTSCVLSRGENISHAKHLLHEDTDQPRILPDTGSSTLCSRCVWSTIPSTS